WWVARRGCGRIEERVRERTERIREQNRALVELAKQDSAAGAGAADLQDVLRRLTEVASRTMRVARASVWVIDEGRGPRIWCLDQFDSTSGRHTCGVELARADYPRYFRALAEGPPI